MVVDLGVNFDLWAVEITDESPGALGIGSPTHKKRDTPNETFQIDLIKCNLNEIDTAAILQLWRSINPF